jgi:chaperonin GroES
VLALGKGKDDEGRDVKDLFTVKAGERVLISKYGGTEVKVAGEDLLIINETDILGIVG